MKLDRDSKVPLASLQGFPSEAQSLSWTIGALADRVVMIAQFEGSPISLPDAIFRAFQGVVAPDVEFGNGDFAVWIAERDRIASACRDVVLSDAQAKAA